MLNVPFAPPAGPKPAPPTAPATLATAGSRPMMPTACLELRLHQLKRRGRVPADDAAQLPGVLLREKPLRNDDVQIHVQPDRRREQQHRDSRMIECDAERAPVAILQGFEQRLERPSESRGPAPVAAAQEPRAHHRRRRQRDDERDQYRDRERIRELAEQNPDQSSGEFERDEYRDQRQAHRQHREADLPRALERGPHRRHARFDVPRRVLHDDDRVVDDEARRDRERHQRKIVE